MTQETICPACGAPIVITDQREAVQCTFCGADISAEGEGEQVAFRVIHQPEPQKETLSKPVEGHGDLTGAAQVYAESGMADAGSVRASEAPAPAPMQFDSAGPSFTPDLGSQGATVYPATPERKGLSGVNRWWVIGGAVLLGLFLLCACLVAIVLAVAPSFNF